MYTINFWPILISALVSFGIGALWYSPILFGKEWMALMKLDSSDIEGMGAKTMTGSYAIHLIANIISFGVLAFIIAISSAQGGSDGAFIGLIAWLGFVAPISVSNLLWRRDPLKLVLIDTLQILICLVISGAIIGAWK
ncbi:MAG: DUF1761 domain-containing protein [Patescibacteria group bacterium]